MNNIIGIIGCGWLGLPLAQHFVKNGFVVKGTTTSEDKLKNLIKEGIDAYYLSISEREIKGAIIAFLDQVHTLIINVPPKLRGENKENYVVKMELLHKEIQKSSIKNVIFVSSTSVYGNFIGHVTESTEPQPDTASGKQMLQAEAIFKNDAKLATTIIRFGGLISEDRHPVTMLSKRTGLKNGHHAVNLIHRNDCIRIISAVIKEAWWNEIIHGVYPEHPSKKTYYTAEALKRGLKAPNYDNNFAINGKIIQSHLLLNVKKFRFLTSI